LSAKGGFVEKVHIGKFFVWTKDGRRPRYAHVTYASALKEAKRLAALNPGKRFIVQEFHDKVFVDVETAPATDGEVALTMEKVMKKTLWAGVVNGQIGFFSQNPDGNVEGLQASRKFYVENNTLTDDQGSILDNTAHGGGQNTTDIAHQTANKVSQPTS
jgi:hypothetical protein